MSILTGLLKRFIYHDTLRHFDYEFIAAKLIKGEKSEEEKAFALAWYIANDLEINKVFIRIGREFLERAEEDRKAKEG